MPRFVVLAHDWPSPHFDLMLECNGTLRTWRLPEAPHPGCAIPAEPLPDHRRRYLEYEGPVGSNRGWVVQWDKGTYDVDTMTAEELSVHLHGSKLHGAVRIGCESPDHWSVEVVGEPTA